MTKKAVRKETRKAMRWSVYMTVLLVSIMAGVYAAVYYATGYANSTPSTVGELSSKIVASVRVDGYTKDTFVNDDFLDGLALYLDVNPKAVGIDDIENTPLDVARRRRALLSQTEDNNFLSVSTRSLLIASYGSVDVDFYVLSDAEYIQSLIDKINALGYDTVEGTTAKSSFITSLQQAGFTETYSVILTREAYQLMPPPPYSAPAPPPGSPPPPAPSPPPPSPPSPPPPITQLVGGTIDPNNNEICNHNYNISRIYVVDDDYEPGYEPNKTVDCIFGDGAVQNGGWKTNWLETSEIGAWQAGTRPV